MDGGRILGWISLIGVAACSGRPINVPYATSMVPGGTQNPNSTASNATDGDGGSGLDGSTDLAMQNPHDGGTSDSGMTPPGLTGPVGPAWPMWGYSPQHSFHSPNTFSSSGVRLKWTLNAPLTTRFSLPVIDQSGVVYANELHQTGHTGLIGMPTMGPAWLASISPSGSINWTAMIQAVGSPVIGTDGTVYVGALDQFAAFDSSGHMKWTLPLSITSMATIDEYDNIYVQGVLNDLPILYKIQNGAVVWQFSFGAVSSGQSAPAVGGDGTVYFGSIDSDLYAVKADGTLKWSLHNTNTNYDQSPTVDADGTIYFFSLDHNENTNVFALKPDSTQLWSRVSVSQPAVGDTGTLYCTPSIVVQNLVTTQIFAIDSQNSSLWSVTPNTQILNGTPLYAADTLIFNTIDGSGLYAVHDSDGSFAWTWSNFGGTSFSEGYPPALSNDGSLYFVNLDGGLSAVGK